MTFTAGSCKETHTFTQKSRITATVMDERERQRRILNFIYAQPDIPTSVRHAFRQWMADQERNPEVDRLMEALGDQRWKPPEKIRRD